MPNRGVLIAALLVLTPGCAAQTYTKSLLISEASLSAIGDDFVAASDEIAPRCNIVPRRAPDELCDSFKAFQQKFKPLFQLAANLWLSARNARDAAVQSSAAAAIRSLAGELAGYLQQLAPLVKGGS